MRLSDFLCMEILPYHHPPEYEKFSLRLIGQTLNEHSTLDAQIGKAALATQIENLDR